MPEHQGNKIFVINYMGVIFGTANSLNVTFEYGRQGIYEISNESKFETGYIKMTSNLIATLQGLSLYFGRVSDIMLIRVEDDLGKQIDYQVVGKQIKGDNVSFPVLCGPIVDA